MRSLLVPVLVLLAGCDLYFDGDDDDTPCLETPPIAPLELRNPDNGQCQPFGGFPCDGTCGPCAEAAADQAQPDWGVCYGGCDFLDEASCSVDPSCRVVYDANSNVDEPPRFLACWSIAPSGPAPAGGCDGLDAQSCSRHNDCVAMYDDLPDGTLQFARCTAEASGCFGDQDCGPGSHCSVTDGACGSPPGCGPDVACPDVCYGTCVPNSPTCEAIDCGPGTHCEEYCTVDPNGTTVCKSECVPDQAACASLPTEADCQGRADCNAIYQGENCTCHDDGSCACEVLTYDHCETK